MSSLDSEHACRKDRTGHRRRPRARPRLCRKTGRDGRRCRDPRHARKWPGRIWRGHHADGGGGRGRQAISASAPIACSATSPKARTSNAWSRRPSGHSGRSTSSSTTPAATSRPPAASPTRTTPSTSRRQDVRAVLDRNLLSTILTCQAVARGMMERRRGRIVTIGSVAAFKGRTNGSIYAVAKAGMTHYTRCLADQLRAYDIAVNCIAPGDTRTGRFLGTREVDPEPHGRDRHARAHRDRRRGRPRRRVSSQGPRPPSSRDRFCESTAAGSAGLGEALMTLFRHCEEHLRRSNPFFLR